MTKPIEFYFEFGSPYSYLAGWQLAEIATAIGRSVRWRPIELGKVWAAQGIAPSDTALRVKRRYIAVDATRVAASIGAPFVLPKPFPPDARLARLAVHGLSALDAELGGKLTRNIWRRMWGEGGSAETEADIVKCLPDGVGSADLLGRIQALETHDLLDAANADAIASSCFGVPWIVADGEAYFGQDRLALMRQRLAGR